MTSASFEDLGRQTKESAERLGEISPESGSMTFASSWHRLAKSTQLRVRSDRILSELVQPAAEVCGFRSLRADNISEPGIITYQVLEHLIEDAMVVADLTGRNANVFYELAVPPYHPATVCTDCGTWRKASPLMSRACAPLKWPAPTPSICALASLFASP
jgi:hypothetical protein